MATTMVDMNIAKKAIAVLDEMIERQSSEVRKVALRIRPDVTDEDLRDPRSVPDLKGHPQFQLEHARLESLRAAKLTLQTRLVGTTLAPTG